MVKSLKSETEQNIEKQPIFERCLLRIAQWCCLFIYKVLEPRGYHMTVILYKEEEEETEADIIPFKRGEDSDGD